MITPKFIFARYHEDINWIYKYPLVANNAIIYNKGKSIEKNNSFNTPIIELSNIPNHGRESDTYLNHIVNNYTSLDDYIIFSQANPFDHSPNFIKIIHYMYDNQLFNSYQPLTEGWKIKENVPPIQNIKYDTREYMGEYPIYMEVLSNTLDTIGYIDYGIQVTLNHFRSKHQIINAENTLKTLLNITGLQNKYCGMLKFNYGGIFGVSKEKILQNTKSLYNRLNRFVNEDWSHGFMMERLWYTIFN